MEINSTNPSTNSNVSDWNATNTKSAAAPVADNAKSAVSPVADNAKTVAAQQDKVTLSPEAVNAQKQEQVADAGAAKAAPAAGAAAPKAADQAAAPKTAAAAGAGEKQPVAKSFVYGALGLERPEKVEDKPTDGYTVGRWIAAGITAGAIISILV